MADETATTLEALRGQLRVLTTQIREAEDSYRRMVETAADAEAVYRAELGRAIKAHREAGTAATTAETLARGEVVVHSRERDVTAGLVKLAAEVIENRRDDRRNLWRLIDVIRLRALTTEDERVPAATWPGGG